METRSFRRSDAQELPGSLTEELALTLRNAALNDERVHATLGERFAHINTDLIPARKGQQHDCAEPLATRLIFFSHSNKIAVEVRMRGAYVHEVNESPGFQPPEGSDEIREAICLARADERIKERVQLLSADAILLPGSPEDLGYGCRMIWVTFTDPAETEDEKPALFSAAVDLIQKKVVLARAEPPIQRTAQNRGETKNAR
jgi:hypothetical protein